VVVIFSAGLGVLLLLGLNGNAGRWVAKPNGVDILDKTAPSAALAEDNRSEDVQAEQAVLDKAEEEASS